VMAECSDARQRYAHCHSVDFLQCKFFCSAENFFSSVALHSRKSEFRSDYAMLGDADDDVDHSEAGAFVSGSRCFFGQRSMHRPG
jgi:hypothetical protein